MNARLRHAAQWLLEPSLLLRTALSVLVAFVAVWAVLLGYNYIQARQLVETEPGLKRFGDALLRSLSDIEDPAEARVAVATTERWVNIRRRENPRVAGSLLIELRDAQGRVLHLSPLLREWPASAAGPGRVAATQLHGQEHLVYEARSARWQLRVAEPVRGTAQILSYNARALLPYLLLALPIVLVPVWMSARNGLQPLRQLAVHIERRDPDSLDPVALPVRHRELKPLVQALDDLLARLRARVARERGFVQDAAHELRTPLAAVTAQAHVMAATADAVQRAQAHAQLEQAIARVSHLARQLLVLAALDEASRPEPRRIDVAQAVRQLMAQAAPAAMERGIELSLEAPDALWCELDEPALESIVSNLVDNAVRYGRDGGCVAVRVGAAGGRLEILVQDDGPGIAAADREKVFERFWRGAGHDRPGSGLGLAIVRRAAARLGGGVELAAGLGGTGVGFRVSAGVACAAPPRSSAAPARP